MSVALAVGGMHCASCGLLIDDVVEDLVGVEWSETDSRRGRTVVRADMAATSVAEIVAAIAEAGYAAAPLQGDGATADG